MSEQQAQVTKTRAPFEFSGELTIAVDVSDLDRAIEWYTEALGLELEYKLDDLGWCELKTPYEGVTIGLGQTEETKARGGATPTFGVRDIADAKRHLEAHGARFESEPYDVAEMVRLVTFYDPDGNPYMLAQMLRGVAGAE